FSKSESALRARLGRCTKLSRPFATVDSLLGWAICAVLSCLARWMCALPAILFNRPATREVVNRFTRLSSNCSLLACSSRAHELAGSYVFDSFRHVPPVLLVPLIANSLNPGSDV